MFAMQWGKIFCLSHWVAVIKIPWEWHDMCQTIVGNALYALPFV
jgi:hypothetical protein